MIEGVDIERDVRATMRDGVQLRADVYRPSGSAPRPTLLLRLPYNKTAADADVACCHPAWFVRQGFMVVVQDVRGTWASGGEFVPFGAEAQDGYDTIEWAAQLPGCDGRVATYGFSYPGYCQLQAATLKPVSLVSMAPTFTGSQAYDGWTYTSGALTGFAILWAAELARDAARRARDAPAFGRLQAALARGGDEFWAMLPSERLALIDRYGGYVHDWLAHPSYDDYWKRWSIDADYARIDTPALHVGGWWDAFVRSTVRNFRGLRAAASGDEARRRQKLVIGGWRHLPWSPIASSGSGAREIDDLHVRWFQETLHARQTGILDAPVSAYVLEEGWSDFADWPPPEAQVDRYHLHSEGRANTRFGDGHLSKQPAASESPDIVIYDPWMAPRKAGGHSCCLDHMVPMGPACQCEIEEWPTVLCYTTERLERDLRIAGDVSVTLFASSTACDTDFCARLCVVDEQGCSTNLLEGIRRARFRDSLEHPSLLRAGEVCRYGIDLGPIAVRVPAGRQLRLDISSSDYPQWQLNMNDGTSPDPTAEPFGTVATQIIFHDAEHPSLLSLPVLPDV